MLRKLDGKRKGSVLQFLYEAELLGRVHVGKIILDKEKMQAGIIDLKGADLSRANLRGADLREADLSRANLSKANLTEAIIVRGFLGDANLHEAILQGAFLMEAILA